MNGAPGVYSGEKAGVGAEMGRSGRAGARFPHLKIEIWGTRV